MYKYSYIVNIPAHKTEIKCCFDLKPIHVKLHDFVKLIDVI